MDLTNMANMYNSIYPSNVNKEEKIALNRKLSMGQRRRSNYLKAGEKENSQIMPTKPPIMAAM